MSYSSLVGSLGVTMLLAAFFLNLFRYIQQGSKLYIVLNIIGAGLSCYASFLIRYWPFVILEGCWMLVSVAGGFGLRPGGSAFRKKEG